MNTMLAFIKSAIILILLAVLLSCSKNNRISELNVAIASDFFPFTYAENDTLKGLEIELLTLLERRLRAPVSITKFSFSNLLETFFNQDFDIALGGVTITDSRKEIFDFSIPYYDATQTVLALKNNPIEIDSLLAISGHRIGVLNNSTSLFLLENTLLRDRSFSINNLRRFNNLETLFAALKNNDVALIILENTIAELSCLENDFKIVYIYDFTEQYAITTKKDSPILKQLNRELIRILDSDEWLDVKKRYFLY